MKKNLLDYPQALVNQIRRLAIAAGEVTLEHFDECGYQGAETKSDGSPVTIADQEAEEIIASGLEDITPGIPMIGEESFADGNVPDLVGHEYFWMVDPLDGTKEFISGSGEYTVNIALIKSGVPVLGVVYAPAREELYAGCGPGTAIRWLAETDNEKEIYVRRPPSVGLTVVASRNHGSAERMDEFLAGYKVAKLVKRGSSLKICAVAAGKADMYPRFGPTCEWDTAAGHAVLLSAGGKITDFSGRPLTYGKVSEKFLNPEFCAASDEIASAV